MANPSSDTLNCGARTDDNMTKKKIKYSYICMFCKENVSARGHGSAIVKVSIVCTVYMPLGSDHLEWVKICTAYDKRQTSDLLRRAH